MSLVPLLSEFEVFNDVEHLLEDPFGLGIHPVDIFRPCQRSVFRGPPRRRWKPYALAKYQRPGRDFPKCELIQHVGKDGFQVCMDVSQFKPNELIVKTVDHNVIVEGKHQEREDEHGFIERHFIRKYSLPKGYDPNDVVSTISSDGVLTVKAPPPPNNSKKSNERIIQIQQTGPAHLSVKEPDESRKQDNGESSDKMETK